MLGQYVSAQTGGGSQVDGGGGGDRTGEGGGGVPVDIYRKFLDIDGVDLL